MQPHLYPTDTAKIAFIISQLQGKALQWADSLWTQKGSVVKSYSSFVAHFRKVFGTPLADSSIGEKLYNLKQGSKSVTDYALQFRTLAASSGWNEQALITSFRQGLEPRRFSPLSDAPTENPVESALVIGDSITRNVKIETPATIVTCLPGARAPDIKANLKVLANANHKYSKIIIHVGTNYVRLRQSEITKINIKEVCELASTMSGEVICSGPLPVRRSDEIVSRLSSLNGWLSKWCPQNNIGFIDNWKSFWGRPDLLKRDGIHPSRDGVALLSSNMAHS
ncbi:uncharacterized protein LOC125262625, partial [Megalobrama amblycephala]|uniref:uncharacterized protein LOC125262625 n=1 Tax=Megalobrama amblycephala TaxID=75352 RepID=UPI00201460CA